MLDYKKRPVTIQAERLTETNANSLRHKVGIENCDVRNDGRQIAIHTLEGTMLAELGDWIIKGVNGEFYPCKPDIFEKTYATPKDWEAEYAPKDAPETEQPKDAPETEQPKEWIERQEEERRAWAVNTAIEHIRTWDEVSHGDVVKLAGEIVEFVKGDESKDLNDVDAQDTFYLVMARKMSQFDLDANAFEFQSGLEEFLIDCADALAKAGVRLKDGERKEES